MINPADPTEPHIHPKYDEVKIEDLGLQMLLRAHIEQRTGRKVYGDVQIVTTAWQRIGDSRTEFYAAQAELYPVE